MHYYKSNNEIMQYCSFSNHQRQITLYLEFPALNNLEHWLLPKEIKFKVQYQGPRKKILK